MLPGHRIPFLRSRSTITIRWKHPAGTVCRTAILHFFASCPAQTAETPCPDTSFTPSGHAFISSYRKDFLIGALSPPNASTRAKANGKAPRSTAGNHLPVTYDYIRDIPHTVRRKPATTHNIQNRDRFPFFEPRSQHHHHLRFIHRKHSPEKNTAIGTGITRKRFIQHPPKPAGRTSRIILASGSSSPKWGTCPIPNGPHTGHLPFRNRYPFPSGAPAATPFSPT